MRKFKASNAKDTNKVTPSAQDLKAKDKTPKGVSSFNSSSSSSSSSSSNTPSASGTRELQLEEKERAEEQYSYDDVNPKAEYDEADILKVWDSYIQSTAKLNYYCGNENDKNRKTQSLFSGNHGMAFSINAGILLKSDGKLYKRKCLDPNQEESVSICGSVHYKSRIIAQHDELTANLEVTLKQVKLWNIQNALNVDQQIISHVILFPYHATDRHWNLGVLNLNFQDDRLIKIIVTAYDPYGQGEVSLKLKNAINTLQENIFKTHREEIDIQSTIPVKHIRQQNDNVSCGPISAENGKFFITGIGNQLNISYDKGATNLRREHLNTVQNTFFYKRQKEYRPYAEEQIKGGEIKNKEEIKKRLLEYIHNSKSKKEFEDIFARWAKISTNDLYNNTLSRLCELCDKTENAELTNLEQLEVIPFTSNGNYTKFELSSICEDPARFIRRDITSLFKKYKDELSKIKVAGTELFSIFFKKDLKYQDGASSILEEIASQYIKNDVPILVAPQTIENRIVALLYTYIGFNAVSHCFEIQIKNNSLLLMSPEKMDIQRIKNRMIMDLPQSSSGPGKHLLIESRNQLVTFFGKIEIQKKSSKTETQFFCILPTDITQSLGNALDKYYSSFYQTQLVAFQGKGEYHASGIKNNLHGDIYQLKLLMLFLHSGVHLGYSFNLATELNDAEKFDDVIFRYAVKEKNTTITRHRYLQAKHNITNSKINWSMLLKNEEDEKNNFSLDKYFRSYLKIKKRFEIESNELQDFIICTNINFDSADLKLKNALLSIDTPDIILDYDNKKAVRYRIRADDFKGKEELYSLLKSTSELITLAKQLAGHVISKEKLELRSEPLKIYHVALATHVIDIKTKKFRSTFIDNKKNKLDERTIQFRTVFFEQLTKQDNKFKSEKDIKNFLNDVTLEISKTFGKNKGCGILPNDSISTELIDEFFNKLVFAVNQPNEVELGEIIEKRISDQFKVVNGELIASQFQKGMLDWLKKRGGKGGTFLSEKDGQEFFQQVKVKLNHLFLIGPTLEYRNVMEKSKITFSKLVDLKTFFDDRKKQVLYIDSQYTLFSSIKVYQILNTTAGYEKDGSYIFIRLESCINLQIPLTKAFLNDMCMLLVIECNISTNTNEVKSLMTELQNTLQKHPKKKIILIQKKVNTNINFFDASFCFNPLYDENSFDGLSKENQTIIKQKSIQFQDVRTTLIDLVPENHLNKVACSSSLLELMTSATLAVDSEPKTLVELENFYMPRSLNFQTEINQNCLRDNLSDIFLISQVTENKLKKLLRDNEKIRSANSPESDINHPARYIMLPANTKDLDAEFQKTITVFPNKTIHLLKKENNFFIWQKTYGLLGGIRKHLSQKINQIPIDEATNKILIVSAEPGMGKTMVINHLIEALKKKDPSLWLIKIDLKVHNSCISKFKFDNINDIYGLLSNILKLSEVGRYLLKYYLQDTGKIKFFLDGYDETNSETQERIITLIKTLNSTTKANQIVIATRRHLQDTLEDATGVFSYNLRPFSQPEQQEFLNRFWKNKLKLDPPFDDNKINTYADALINLLAKSINDKTCDFLGIPLQVRLLAEAFQKEFREYYVSTNQQPELPETLDLVDLYQRFINTKYFIYYSDKLKLNFLGQSHKTCLLNELTKAHQHIAYNVLFENFSSNFISEENKKVFKDQELIDVGIIHMVKAQFSFIHRTFSEYFVATLFFEQLKKPTDHIDNQEAREFLLQHIFKARNFVIRTFVEQLVIKGKNFNAELAWRAICDNNLLGMSKLPSVFDEENIEKDADVKEDVEDQSTEKKLLAASCEGLIEIINQCSGNIQHDKYAKIFPCIYQDIITVTNNNIKQLEKILKALIGLGHNTRYNYLINSILSDSSSLIEHYVVQKILQANGEKIDLKLLEEFSKIHANFSTTNYGNQVAERVQSSKVRFQKQRKIYTELSEINSKPPNPKNMIEFLKIMTPAKILYLKIAKTLFGKNEINILKKHYKDKSFKENDLFKELFLQINLSEANVIKDFLIQHQEYKLMLKLLEKFEPLDLTDQDIDNIYSNKDLLWLERTGIEISSTLKVLTPTMANIFKSILNANKINGYHTRYADNIFSYLLKQIDFTGSSRALCIHKSALINMYSYFIAFIVKYNYNGHLEACYLKKPVLDYKLGSILMVVEKTLNNPLISLDMLSTTIDDLIRIANSLKLNIVNMKNTLLILEPIHEFSHHLSLKPKEQIVHLLKYKIKNFNNNSDYGFTLECVKCLNEMFPMQPNPKFRTQFHMFTSHCINNQNSQRQGKKRRRSASQQ